MYNKNDGVSVVPNNYVEQFHTINIEIPDEPIYYDSIANEWIDATAGYESTKSHKRERQMEKVPPLLFTGNKIRWRDYYEPVVVALGPYHHKKTDLLHKAEKYKHITLQFYASNSGKSINDLYNKVLEVIVVARKYYIDGSTIDYDNKQFAQMMLLDGCFVLFFIESVSRRDKKLMLNNEYLGALGFSKLVHDIFLLENQLPFNVLQVLLNLKFEDKGEEILNKFFNYLNYGEIIQRKEKVFPAKEEKQPLHLLELYRSYFISIKSLGLGSGTSSSSGKWGELNPKSEGDDHFNYVNRNRSFPSATELKAKGIFLRPTPIESLEDIKFHSHCYYSQLEVVWRAVSSNSKFIFLNMIAYEMCPGNPNDLRIATYIKFMKSLIVHADDVKELCSKKILVHSLDRDEEVVKMYEEIDTPAVNSFMFDQLKRGIENHCNNVCKTWVAELISLYFNRPWKPIALFVAAALLLTSLMQTFFTISPLPDKSVDNIVSILKNCTSINQPQR